MDQALASQVKTVKRRAGPIRRLENGLLDVSRKSGKHVKTIRANSQAQLLRLPPELRNRIWEYALGGQIYNVTTRKVFQRKKNVNKARVWDLPKNRFALLRVCRQIYAETALLPYKHNTFRFESADAFDWVSSLRIAEQNVISKIYIATAAATHMLAKDQVSQRYSRLPDALPLDRFPSLETISFAVYGSFQYENNTLVARQPLAALEQLLIATQELRILLHLRLTKPNVRILFAHVKVGPQTS